MDADHQLSPTRTTCCETWWDNLTPVQKLWLHTRLWDLEILTGWDSDLMVREMECSIASRLLSTRLPTLMAIATVTRTFKHLRELYNSGGA